jgi:hypothetical protein
MDHADLRLPAVLRGLTAAILRFVSRPLKLFAGNTRSPWRRLVRSLPETGCLGLEPQKPALFRPERGKSISRVRPIPRGMALLIAASIMSGATNASEIIIWTDRVLRPSLAAIVAISLASPARSSFSPRRPLPTDRKSVEATY